MAKANNKKITVEDIGRVLRGVRKQLKYTQVDVSKKMGISQGSLSKMETGKAEPSALQWLEFCRMTGIPTDILFKDEVNFAAIKPMADRAKNARDSRLRKRA